MKLTKASPLFVFHFLAGMRLSSAFTRYGGMTLKAAAATSGLQSSSFVSSRTMNPKMFSFISSPSYNNFNTKQSLTVRHMATTEGTDVSLMDQIMTDHPSNNVPQNVADRIGRNLHLRPNHPLNIIKERIEGYFKQLAEDQGTASFEVYDSLVPIVTTKQCFDDLLIPPDHVSRSPSDTYYISDTTLLRTHTSAHQSDLLAKGLDAFLVTGDVYRRDEIDRSHYPAFHQMEGVRMLGLNIDGKSEGPEREAAVKEAEEDLKKSLEGLAKALFGDEIESRWVDAYFPFTEPSYELEIYFQGEWLEVLGCGVIEQPIVRTANRGEEIGWAFGLGLERLAMVLFDIPDIRLFWSEDPRFITQFEKAASQKSLSDFKFKPYSKYPPVYKDISFWMDDGSSSTPAAKGEEEKGEKETAAKAGEDRKFHPNDLFEIVRDIAGDLVEEVTLIDKFTHPKTGRDSECYRVVYRSMERSLTDEEINKLQDEVRDRVEKDFQFELR